MKAAYILVDKKTKEAVAYTIISPDDYDSTHTEDEILETRLEAAIDDEIIPDSDYEWKIGGIAGVLI